MIRGTPGLIAVALLLAGCFVSSTDRETVALQVTVGTPGAATYSLAAGDSTPWDTMDRFHLDEFPKYVRVAVEPEGQDYEQSNGTWPDPQLGVGAGEGPAGEVDVSLEVPPGSYRLRVLGFVTELGRVLVYAEQQPLSLSLSAGQSRDVDLQTSKLDTGKIAVSVRCQQGSIADWSPTRISLWDARAAVLFPAVKLEQTSTGALEAEIPAVPVGRQFWAHVVLVNKQTGKEAWVDYRRLFGLQQANDVLPVSIVIPCMM
jgi:hypothetical protein